MLLGLSGQEPGATTTEAIAGSEHGDSGVTHGALLARFAEAIHDGVGLDDVRAEVIDVLGPAGFVDAAAVCANFNMMVRIADGTGTPLDEGTVAISEDVRNDLGLNTLTSNRMASTTPDSARPRDSTQGSETE